MTHTKPDRNVYSIHEAACLCGMPESTLRYYESVGIIQPTERDASGKNRIYTEKTLDTLVAISCLRATGMSLKNMRAYLANSKLGEDGAAAQLELLEAQKTRLAEEANRLRMKQEYVSLKIRYWNAMGSGDADAATRVAAESRLLADNLKAWKAEDSARQ